MVSASQFGSPKNSNSALNDQTKALIKGNDKRSAFEEFKQKEGRQFNKSLLAEKEHYKETVLEIKDLTAQINNTKKVIDSLKVEVEQKRKMGDEVVINGEKVIDEEEYKILKDLSDAKRDYREISEKLNEKKDDLRGLEEYFIFIIDL